MARSVQEITSFTLASTHFFFIPLSFLFILFISVRIYIAPPVINNEPPVQHTSPSGGPISVQPYSEFPDVVLRRLSQSNSLNFITGRVDLYSHLINKSSWCSIYWTPSYTHLNWNLDKIRIMPAIFISPIDKWCCREDRVSPSRPD